MKWPSSTPQKFQVKVKPLKLQGFSEYYHELQKEDKTEKVIVLEMKWKGLKARLVSLRRQSSKHRRHVSKPAVVKHGQDIRWDYTFESVCTFSQKDSSWDISFNLLYGRCTEPTNKLVVIGFVSLNIAELASLMEPQIERKLPVSVRFAGLSSEAMLSVSLSFIEIRNLQDSVGVVNDTGLLRVVKDFTGLMSDSKNKDKNKDKNKNKNKKKKKKKKKKRTLSSLDEGDLSDDSYSGDGSGDGNDSEESPSNHLKESEELTPSSTENCVAVAAATKDESTVYYGNGSDKENSSETQSESSLTQKTEMSSSWKAGFLSWKRRRPSFVFSKSNSKGKETASVKKSKVDADQKTNETSTVESSSKSEIEEEETTVGGWEEKELISRDGRAKLRANVFFASMDQRSEKAAGESACTALVTVIADWLHSNRDTMPSRSEFDNLIKEGSSEWRKLCNNEVNLQRFPDKHFDLETMLEAELRPVTLKPEKSFVGFFCPDKFESLKGAMCFDGIWDEISRSNIKELSPKVYIVSWNDHFFVLKVEADAYYIIDTLGERLFEGCKKAYVLKFDNSSCLYRLPENTKKEGKKDKKGADHKEGEESESLVCSGKECCREFITRFLAAIPLKELEKQEEKGTASIVSLHQRLQIEFHFTSVSIPASSSSSIPSLSSSCDQSPLWPFSSSLDESEDSCLY